MDISTLHVQTSIADYEMHAVQRTPASQQETVSPITPCNMFLTGYMDCTQEALWYLTEVECLPLDHPIVAGLRWQLHEQYRVLQLQYMLSNNLHVCNETESSHLHTCNTEDRNNLHMCDREASGVHNEQLIPLCKGSITTANVSDRNGDDNVGMCAIEIETESNCVAKSDDIENSIAAVTETIQNGQSDPEVDSSPEVELSPEAQRVAVALAEEIYSLLQSQDDLSDIDDDESDYIDEGFEDMTES